MSASAARLQPYRLIPRRWGRRPKYPLRTMLVNDMFPVDCASSQTIEQVSNSVTSCISSIERQTGRTFEMRREFETIWVRRVK